MSTYTTNPLGHPGEVLVPVPPGWTLTLTAPDGYTIAGHPSAYPVEGRTTIDDRQPAATDHPTWYDDGISIPVTFGTGPAVPWDILAVRINRIPTDNATPGTAGIQLIDNHWINHLGSTDLTDLAAKGHALLDALTHAAQHTADIGKRELAGIHLPITTDDQPTREREVLSSTIHYTPATSTKPPTPTISIRVINNTRIVLTPTTLTDFTTRAHAYFDMLTKALTPTPTTTDQTTSPNT